MSKLSITTFIIAALASPAFAGGGQITGSVQARPHKYLEDTVVFVKQVNGAHTGGKTVQIDQRGMTFSPHIVTLTVGDTVRFQNHDNVQHNVMSPEGHYDLGVWGQGQTKSHTFTTPGVYSQVCKIHPEMLAYVFVGQNPYAAVVDASGKFTIAGVPAGTYELDVWNPKLKAPPQKVTVGAGGTASVQFSIAR